MDSSPDFHHTIAVPAITDARNDFKLLPFHPVPITQRAVRPGLFDVAMPENSTTEAFPKTRSARFLPGVRRRVDVPETGGAGAVGWVPSLPLPSVSASIDPP